MQYTDLKKHNNITSFNKFYYINAFVQIKYMYFSLQNSEIPIHSKALITPNKEIFKNIQAQYDSYHHVEQHKNSQCLLKIPGHYW